MTRSITSSNGPTQADWTVTVDPVEPLTELTDRIGHCFEHLEYLDRALSHRSWCAENGDVASNERLEFLGDAVLGWVIADLSFHRFSDVPEGRLTDLRKSVVNATALAEIARKLDLGRHIKLGRGEAAAGGADKSSILSDAFEAVLGAVYLDGGAEAAFGFVEREVAPRLDASLDVHVDHKTELQERCARLGHSAPKYSVTFVGPDHARVFTAMVSIDDEEVGVGEGGSKKAAEQQAAAAANASLS